jgi:hypothetical protein
VNESIKLEASVGRLKKMVGALTFLVVLLAVANMGTSVAIMKLSMDTTLDENGHLMMKDGSKMITTVGQGESFTFHAHRDGDRKYTCVPPEDSAEMWRAAANGVTTTACMVEEDDNGNLTEETGLAFLFDGASANKTHVCFPTTIGRNFCIDFTDDRCQTGEEGEPKDHHERRKLFEYLTASPEKQAEMDMDGIAIPKSEDGGLRHGRRLCSKCWGGGGTGWY